MSNSLHGLGSATLDRNLALILLTNVILGALMPMLIIPGALAGASLASLAKLITLPMSVQLLAGILFAIPLSVYMGKHGRRSGFLMVAVCPVTAGLLAVTVLVHEGAGYCV